jgi:hypothetical protein
VFYRGLEFLSGGVQVQFPAVKRVYVSCGFDVGSVRVRVSGHVANPDLHFNII